MSRGLFEGPSVRVQGFRWCRDEAKTIGRDSLTVNILCKTHNEMLSDTDATAGRLQTALVQIMKRNRDRLHAIKHFGTKRFRVEEYRVNGVLFERWAIKTAVNLFNVEPRPGDCWHLTKSAPMEPPAEIVAAAFGARPLDHPMGLWLTAAIGDTYTDSGGFSSTPLFSNSSEFVALQFEFRGARFVIWLTPGAFGMHSNGNPFDPVYRLKTLNFQVQGRPSQVLELEW